MAENYYNISSHIDDLIPEHINTDYPELVQFMKVYALYLEHRNKSGFYLNQLDHQRDIDLIEEELLDELQNEIGIAIPRTFSADPRIFYRRLVEFYKSRGTPESIHAFFNLIYNDEVEIYFPKVDMLIPSFGKWFNTDISHLEASLNTATNTIVNRCDIPEGATSFDEHTKEECEALNGVFTSQYKTFYPTNTWTLTVAANEITRHMVDDLGYMPLFDDAVIAVKMPGGNWELYTGHTEELDQVPDKCILPDTSVTYDITEEACTALSGTYTARHMHTNLCFPEILPIGTVISAFKKGVYTEVDGFLSDKKYIQDSYFYQKFSYVLRTGRNIDDWKSAFTRLVHPAGFIFFGQIYLYITALTDQTGLFKYEDTEALEASTYDLGTTQDGWYQPGYQIKLFRIDIDLGPIYSLPGVHDTPFEFYNGEGDTGGAFYPTTSQLETAYTAAINLFLQIKNGSTPDPTYPELAAWFIADDGTTGTWNMDVMSDGDIDGSDGYILAGLLVWLQTNGASGLDPSNALYVKGQALFDYSATWLFNHWGWSTGAGAETFLLPKGTLIQADTYIEKSFVRPGSIGFDYLNDGSIELREVVYNESLLGKTIGFKDHFENTKFYNPRPIGEFGTLTFEDAINKRIGNIQIGAQVTEATI